MIPPLSERVQEAVGAAEKKKSVKEIAAACDVSVQSVYDWRKGKTTNLRGETLVELAEVSGYSARWIINGKGSKHGLSDNAKTIIEALPLISDDLMESWLDAARKAIEKARAKTKRA